MVQVAEKREPDKYLAAAIILVNEANGDYSLKDKAEFFSAYLEKLAWNVVAHVLDTADFELAHFTIPNPKTIRESKVHHGE